MSLIIHNRQQIIQNADSLIAVGNQLKTLADAAENPNFTTEQKTDLNYHFDAVLEAMTGFQTASNDHINSIEEILEI